MGKGRKMPHQLKTTEQILQELIRRKGIDYLRTDQLFVNAIDDLGGAKEDVTLLRYLVKAGGVNALLDAGNQTPVMRQTVYSQTVEKVCKDSLISQELANKVCAIFWRAVYGEEPPVQRKAPPPDPQSEESPDELFARTWAYDQQENMEEAVRLYHQAADLGLEEAKSKLLQLEAQRQHSPLQEDPSPVQKGFSYYDKSKYYISREFAQKGGKLSVYYKNDKVEIELPPNTCDGKNLRPVMAIRVLDVEKCDFKEDLANYSDDLITGYFARHKFPGPGIGIKGVFLMLFYLYLIAAVTAAVYAMLYPILFKFELPSWLLWGWPIPATIFFMLYFAFEDYQFRNRLHQEITRRKGLRLRNP